MLGCAQVKGARPFQLEIRFNNAENTVMLLAFKDTEYLTGKEYLTSKEYMPCEQVMLLAFKDTALREEWMNCCKR